MIPTKPDRSQARFWDWPICADRYWDGDDDFVIYDDPDHAGWYRL
jgi:hypothetical protein